MPIKIGGTIVEIVNVNSGGRTNEAKIINHSNGSPIHRRPTITFSASGGNYWWFIENE